MVSRDCLVVRTLRCGRSNPGSNPGPGMPFLTLFIFILPRCQKNCQLKIFCSYNCRWEVRIVKNCDRGLENALSVFRRISLKYSRRPERLTRPHLTFLFLLKLCGEKENYAATALLLNSFALGSSSLQFNLIPLV